MLTSTMTDSSTMFTSLMTAAVALVACYVIHTAIRYKRMLHALEHIPNPPCDNFIYGHAKLFFDKETNRPSGTVVYRTFPDYLYKYDGKSVSTLTCS